MVSSGQLAEVIMVRSLTQDNLFITGTLLLIALLVILIFNGLVKARSRAREAWAGIEVQLKRRADLVLNLVSIVKGYANHETKLLDEVAQRHAEAARAPSPATAGQADLALGAAVGRLLAVSENYPSLKASDNFLELQQELADVEEKIAYARRFYNQSARAYNIGIDSVPVLLVARFCRFGPIEYFQADSTDREPVQVSSTH
jgi:LemA protein